MQDRVVYVVRSSEAGQPIGFFEGDLELIQELVWELKAIHKTRQVVETIHVKLVSNEDVESLKMAKEKLETEESHMRAIRAHWLT